MTHLGDGTHTKLVKGASEERSEGRHKRDSTVSAGSPNAHTHQVLLSNKAFNVPARENLG